MKNKVIVFGVVGLLALIAGDFLTAVAPLDPIDREPVLEKPEATKQETFPESNNIKVKRLDLSKANVTFLTSEVNPDSVDDVINDINMFNTKGNKPIYLILDSPGGSVMDGARLMDVIQSSKNPVISINTGLCASMCFMILEHSHKRFGLQRATLMGHPASLGVLYRGELDKIVSRLTYMKRFVDKMDKFIAKRAGLTYESFKLLTQQELWIDSEDSLQKGLLDEIVAINIPSISEVSPNSGSAKMYKDFKLE